ncbi:exonuclease domain-containing protein [Solirhodobacter olei]|uniref:exonuclease domain-containing protein n=1 Tax=Solirhodobacter olei TaxID=2493082 RepID=UPI000FD8AAD0|nr:exonuclease domain-containing protein [Solirhodobacter olei]
MKILNYDTESTGLEKPFEAPLQFAAKVYDATGSELSAVNLRGRPPLHVLPSPGALAVTGQRINSVMRQETSAYALARQIHLFFEQAAPAVVTGYNIIGYDEEILRHTFYANLLQPYVTQFGGNERLDVLLAMKAAAICDPDAYDLPVNEKGKRSFKLEHLAPVFGFENHDAHDALGDVDATMHVANTIRARSPKLWRATHSLRSKNSIDELLASGQPVVKLDWNHRGDKATTRVLLPICRDAEISTKWWCVNLAADPSRVIGIQPDQLVRAFKSSGGLTPIVGVTTNKMPLVFSMEDPAIAGLIVEFDGMLAEQLRMDGSLATSILTASQMIRDGYEEKVHVQEQLYSGGFFPAADDRALFDAFHRADPAQKPEIIAAFHDPRARELGKLLMGSEWPEAMPPGDRATYLDELQYRMTAMDVPWMSIPKALDEIKSLRPAVGETAVILDEYEAYLRAWSLRGASFAAE